jgi:hypothetical protein
MQRPKRSYTRENDHHWGPLTWCKAHPGWFGIQLNSGAREDDAGYCHIIFYLFGFVLICELPNFIPDYVERHEAKTWDAETIARMGRDWYEIHYAREIGFLFTGGGAVSVYYGPDTDEWEKRGHTMFSLPWRQWRFIRTSYYDRDRKHFWTEPARDKTAWPAKQAIKQALPKVYFQIEDYDGEIITAATTIEEREWHFGTKWCKWLSAFVQPKIRRDLKIDFSAEVGKEKGSWKGGVLGHGINMSADETHAQAFARYCEQEFRSKEGRYHIRNLGEMTPVEALNA